MVKVEVAAAVGVPLSTPVVLLRAKPAGRLPLPNTTIQAYGVLPPVAVKVNEYGVPTCPLGGMALLMVGEGAGAILIETACEAVCPAGSLTVIMKLAVPAAVGVPVTAAVEEFNFRPAGSWPELTVQA